jgi:hypothetical protein
MVQSARKFVSQILSLQYYILNKTVKNNKEFQVELINRTILLYRLPFLRILCKIKVKLSLCLTKHHAMQAYWEVEV